LFIETSALDSTNVESAFRNILIEIYNRSAKSPIQITETKDTNVELSINIDDNLAEEKTAKTTSSECLKTIASRAKIVCATILGYLSHGLSVLILLSLLFLICIMLFSVIFFTSSIPPDKFEKNKLCETRVTPQNDPTFYMKFCVDPQISSRHDRWKELNSINFSSIIIGSVSVLVATPFYLLILVRLKGKEKAPEFLKKVMIVMMAIEAILVILATLVFIVGLHLRIHVCLPDSQYISKWSPVCSEELYNNDRDTFITYCTEGFLVDKCGDMLIVVSYVASIAILVVVSLLTIIIYIVQCGWVGFWKCPDDESLANSCIC